MTRVPPRSDNSEPRSLLSRGEAAGAPTGVRRAPRDAAQFRSGSDPLGIHSRGRVAPPSPPTVSVQDARASEAMAHWPKPLLPLLLVNVGSGVSCLLVSREGYARVGGTALGGATSLAASTFSRCLVSFAPS